MATRIQLGQEQANISAALLSILVVEVIGLVCMLLYWAGSQLVGVH